MNMKVAGTIGQFLKKKTKIPVEDSPNKNDTSIIDSECQSSNTNDVWDKSLFEGLTSKQKKNLRKKLQRQRKKKGADDKSSQMQSSNVDASGKDDLSGIGNDDIGDINIDIDAKPEVVIPDVVKQETAEKKEE